MPDKRNPQHRNQVYGVNDEIAYAGRTMRYGRVVRLLGAGDQAQIEIEFEDGGREVHKMRDRALSLVRRASGASERQEELTDRGRLRDPDIEAVRKSDQRKRW